MTGIIEHAILYATGYYRREREQQDKLDRERARMDRERIIVALEKIANERRP